MLINVIMYTHVANLCSLPLVEDYVLYFTQMGQLVEKATVVVKIINDDGKESTKECFELILPNEIGYSVIFCEKKMIIYIVNDDKDKKMKCDGEF